MISLLASDSARLYSFSMINDDVCSSMIHSEKKLFLGKYLYKIDFKVRIPNFV